MSIYVLQDQTKQHSNENGWDFLFTHHPQYVTPLPGMKRVQPLYPIVRSSHGTRTVML